MRGFWISKYEISDNNKFIPNVSISKNDTLDNYITRINNLSNDYGIMDSVDSHVVSNLEWGAVLYLSHSKYGVCRDNKCLDIGNNKSYISENNKQDTTTRDVYGVYDMSGSSSEYTVGNNMLGSALSEVRINDGETWYGGVYINNNKDFVLRGGVDMGLFSVSDIGMIDVSTRSVLVSK